MKHTSGPWKLERPSRKRGGHFDEKQAITAGAYGTVCVCTRADARSDTDSPNAKLIRSSPELYDFVRDAFHYHRQLREEIGLPERSGSLEERARLLLKSIDD